MKKKATKKQLAALAKGRAKLKKKRAMMKKKPHKRITKKCMKCGKYHKAGVHKSHGKGSYKRTH